MELVVYDINGKQTDKKILVSEDLLKISLNEHVLYLDVKSYLNNQRQGNSKTKCRSEVAGSTRKMKKQKGTGGARAGSIRNPLYKGGGTIFGPMPKNYYMKINKKTKLLARNIALGQKLINNNVLLVNDFDFDEPKTKNFVDILKNLKMSNSKTLLVANNNVKNVFLASRNLKFSNVLNYENLNTYNIMNNDYLIIFESSFNEIQNNCFKS